MPRSCIPDAAVQRNACVLPLALYESPTMTRPLADTFAASAYPPPSVPMSCRPPAAVQRNARWSKLAFHAWPTTTEPSPETPYASANAYPKLPRSCMLVAVQRNERYCDAELAAHPTTTAPVEDTPYAWLWEPPNPVIHFRPLVVDSPLATSRVPKVSLPPHPTTATSNPAHAMFLLVTVPLSRPPLLSTVSLAPAQRDGSDFRKAPSRTRNAVP